VMADETDDVGTREKVGSPPTEIVEEESAHPGRTSDGIDDGVDGVKAKSPGSQQNARHRRFRSLVPDRWRVKVIIAVSLSLASIGLVGKLGYEFIGNLKHQPVSVTPAVSERSLLVDENLSPFFVPLPTDPENLAVRLDILIRWDRSTRIRFKKDAPLVRSQIYQYLTEFAKKGEDFKSEMTTLEAEMGRIVRRCLGVKDIELFLEEIRFI
jgi:hypothetical protein